MVLIASIFFLDTSSSDITLNLIPGTEEEVQVKGESILAPESFNKLHTEIEEGQMVGLGDTLFHGVERQQLQDMSQWVTLLKTGNLIPTQDLLNKYNLPADINNKLLNVANVGWKYRKPNKNASIRSAKDVKRIAEVELRISNLQQEIKEYEGAIASFKLLEKQRELDFNMSREKYGNKEIELSDFQKAKQKWDDSISDTKLRQKQIRRPKGLLSEFESELKFLNDKKPASSKSTKQKNRARLTAVELETAVALDSFISSQVILASAEGEVSKMGQLDNVQALDTLIYFEGTMEKSNRSKTILALANDMDANRIFPNADLQILLKDGSSVSGIIEGENPRDEFDNASFKIDASEEVSYVDIEQIIIPAKKSNFIEKVLENF